MARAKGSKYVSRQNLTLINSKPLIYYVLKTASSINNADVYVSTDSNEIKEYSESQGVNVIYRPKSLTKDNTDVKEIAHDVISELKNQNKVYEKCLLLHPKFPLITKKTIKKFFLKTSKKIPIIFGYFDDMHRDSNFIKLKNNSELQRISSMEKNIVKFEKIASFYCKTLTAERKVQTPFALKIPDAEILSLYTYHDFGTFEKILNRKKILVRVDGSNKIGLGHVYNMLTLLNNLRNEEILIVIHNSKKLGYKKFKEHLFDVKFFKSNIELEKIITNFKPDIIFNDILNTSVNYMKFLLSKNAFIVNFEDRGPGRKFANMVFNPIFHGKTNRNEYFGHRYVCLREEFQFWTKKRIRKKTQKALITFGGTDPTNKTEFILKIIENSNLKNIEFMVLIGYAFAKQTRIKKYILNLQRSGFKISYSDKSDFIANHMKDADFALCSNGRTVFELTKMRTPMIVVPVNKNENTHNFIKKYNLGFQLDYKNNTNEGLIKNYINKMLDFPTRKKFFNRMKEFNMQNGATDVTQKILTSFSKLSNDA